MHEMHNLIYRTEILLKGCTLLGVPTLFTQQFTEGLGETIPAIREAYVEAFAEANSNVKLAAEDPLRPQEQAAFAHIEKTVFSITDEPAFMEALEASGRREVILSGIESHICVLLSALSLKELGYTVRVAADAVSSRHAYDMDHALARLAQAGVTVTTGESLLFDFLKDSKHKTFPRISALVK
jgi:nicotinamidase-related amidase